MFEVIWLQSALNELTTIWTQADSATRQAITTAANAVDQALRTNPQEEGESREAGERVFFVHPLGITFEIQQERSRVRVLHVWDIRRRA